MRKLRLTGVAEKARQWRTRHQVPSTVRAELGHALRPSSGRTPGLKLFSRMLWPGSQATAVFISWQIGGGRNIDQHILHVAVGVIQESRELRLQPFNEYRKRFGMKPYTSFQEFTGEQLFPGHGPCPRWTCTEAGEDIEETCGQHCDWDYRGCGWQITPMRERRGLLGMKDK